jgi:hypothetical protein
MIDNYRIKQVDDRFYIQQLNVIEPVKIFMIPILKKHEYWYTIKVHYNSLEEANNVIYNYIHNTNKVQFHEYKDEKL